MGIYRGNRRTAVKSLFVCGVFAVCFALGGILHAQNFPPLEPDAAAYSYAEKLARSPSAPSASPYWLDLAEAALWASSVNGSPPLSGADRAAYLDRIRGAAAALAAAPDLPRGAKERGEYILVFMHKNFLKSYAERQTRLDELLRTGRYNCVSSAVLYMILAISAGLDTGGVMTKDHAFATIRAGGAVSADKLTSRELIDVETTNVYGFDPGNRKEFHDGFGKATGFAYVPAKNYRDRAAINPAELVSLILSNRIADMEQRGHFSEAVPLGINREALLSKSAVREENHLFEDPRKDMLTRLLNYGAWLIKAGKDDEALAWAAYAGERFPAEAWQELALAALNNKAVRLIRARKIADARAAMEAERHKVSSEQYSTLDTMILEAEIATRLNAMQNPGEAEAVLKQIAASEKRLSGKSRTELRTAAILKEGERLAKSGGWLDALVWINAAIETYGASSQLENARRTFRHNRIGELHNGFAALFNKKDFSGAKTLIEEALREYPGERQFIQDQDLVERALKTR